MIVGHATFCIVVVYNNVVARLRRTPRVARGGVGRPRRATPGRRSAHVTFPQLRSALVAGALLAFALSFDEVIVTTFTAGAHARRCRSGSSPTSRGPNQLPIVNVVGVVVILLSIIPVYIAQRLSNDPVTSTAAIGAEP